MSHKRIVFSLAALLLSASAFTAPAQAGWFDFVNDKPDTATAQATAKADKPAMKPQAAAQDLDGAIRQAQLLRTGGQYDEAIKHLSQIMLVAADDPRVITEYGKTLAAMGRASDAVNFLSRAQQLSPNDWSVYSAMGVAYDQTGDHARAQVAYDRALTLNKNEASVLNNYALSRMMANDPEGARKLIARAQAAGGSTDPKIARNIAMMLQLAPASEPAKGVAEAAPAPVPVPKTEVAEARPLPPVTADQSTENSQPPGSEAPRPLMANADPASQTSIPQEAPSGVVMQRVPEDPLAGPVHSAEVAKPASTKASASHHLAKTAKPVKAAAKTTSDSKALQAKAEAAAKQLTGTPHADGETVATTSKPEVSKTAAKSDAKPAAKTAEAKPAPVKVADAKAPLKTADAKPAAKKETVPALRISASAY